MKVRVALAALAFVTSGCAAGFASPTGLTSVATALEEVGSAATGFKSTESAAQLNDANKELVEAQAAMTQTQVNENQAEHKRLAEERVVTAKLLKSMSNSYHDPVLLTLAEWVEAGGDPDFAFKYALSHIGDDERTKVIPQQALLLSPVHSAPPLGMKRSANQSAAVTAPILTSLSHSSTMASAPNAQTVVSPPTVSAPAFSNGQSASNLQNSRNAPTSSTAQSLSNAPISSDPPTASTAQNSSTTPASSTAPSSSNPTSSSESQVSLSPKIASNPKISTVTEATTSYLQNSANPQ